MPRRRATKQPSGTREVVAPEAYLRTGATLKVILRCDLEHHSATAGRISAISRRSINIPGRVQKQVSVGIAAIRCIRKRVQNGLRSVRSELVNHAAAHRHGRHGVTGAVISSADPGRSVYVSLTIANQAAIWRTAIRTAVKVKQDARRAGGGINFEYSPAVGGVAVGVWGQGGFDAVDDWSG